MSEGSFSQSSREMLFVSLDVPSIDEACRLADVLAPMVGGFHVAPLLCFRAGLPVVLERLRCYDRPLFLDIKLAVTPNQAGSITALAVDSGAQFISVQAFSGSRVVNAMAEQVHPMRLMASPLPGTVSHIGSKILFGRPLDEQVVTLTQYAREAGANGVICTPRELPLVAAQPWAQRMLLAVEDVQPTWSTPLSDDRRHGDTPARVIAGGADMLIIGSPIIRGAFSPESATLRTLREIDDAFECATPSSPETETKQVYP
jgi:orotidine-5'-phosphate decarboxylase